MRSGRKEKRIDSDIRRQTTPNHRQDDGNNNKTSSAFVYIHRTTSILNANPFPHRRERMSPDSINKMGGGKSVGTLSPETLTPLIMPKQISKNKNSYHTPTLHPCRADCDHLTSYAFVAERCSDASPISAIASLRESLIFPCRSTSSTLTRISSPSLTTSVTFSTRRGSSCET